MVIDDAMFKRPYGFDDKLSEIKRKIASLRAKTSNITFGQSNNTNTGTNTQGSKRF